MKRFLACACLVQGLLYAGDHIQKANSVERCVRFEYRIINQSDQTQDVHLYLSLPRNNERQEIPFLYPEPRFQEILTDSFGNQIAHYIEKQVKPGEMRSHGWIAAVRLDAVAYQTLANAAQLNADERILYTKDQANYQISSPLILDLKNRLVRKRMSDNQKALAIFEYLIANLTYSRDDKWDSAPEVLQKKQGSCSEFNYAFISLLRACGIPCRYAGGFVLSMGNRSRYDEKINEDAVFHRWTEVFLREYGWIPADSSRGSDAFKSYGNYLNLWGRMPAGVLQTYRGDGGKESFLDWDYVAFARSPLRDSLKEIPVCFWIDAKRESLEGAIRSVEQAISKGTPESLQPCLEDSVMREVLFLFINRVPQEFYPALADGLSRVHHPSAIYFSLYGEYLRLAEPDFQKFPFRVDDILRNEIAKFIGKGKWEWGAFEYWWRKARPEISYHMEKKVFFLANPNINIY